MTQALPAHKFRLNEAFMKHHWGQVLQTPHMYKILILAITKCPTGSAMWQVQDLTLKIFHSYGFSEALAHGCQNHKCEFNKTEGLGGKLNPVLC